MKIIFKGFSDDERQRAECDVRSALGKPNGQLEFQPGILLPGEDGLIAVIDGTDEELGDGNKKCLLVDTVFEPISVIATANRAATCKLKKGLTSKTRSPFQ